MRIKHRYTFRDDYNNRKIKCFLDMHNIKHNTSSGIPLISIEVFEDKDYWSELDKLMVEHRALSLIYKVFSKNEIKNADWLTLRGNWRLGYPQPDKEFLYRTTTYSDKNFCTNCGCGLEQKEEFRMRKQINWGNKNFLMLYWVEDEIFISDKVVKEFQKQNVSGVTFIPVKRLRTDEEYNDIKQMKVNTILKKGLILDESEIIENTNCEKCNERKYVLKGRKQLLFKSDVFKDCPDVIKSHEIFGTGMIAAREIIVSNKVGNIILNNGWDRNVILEPLSLG